MQTFPFGDMPEDFGDVASVTIEIRKKSGDSMQIITPEPDEPEDDE